MQEFHSHTVTIVENFWNITFDFDSGGGNNESFAGRNDGSACTNRQSADHGQNVITRCIRSPRIGKRLSDFTGRNMRIYETAAMGVFIEYAISQLRVNIFI